MLMSLTFQCMTQEVNSHQYSSAPENSRFQIVQSELTVMLTFKVDKYTGSVFLLLKGKSGLTWQLMDADVQVHDEKIPNQVNYQILASDNGIKSTFLINVNTGVTWQLTKDKKSDVFLWVAIE